MPTPDVAQVNVPAGLDVVERDELVWFRKRINTISGIHFLNLVVIMISFILVVISLVLGGQFITVLPLLALAGAFFCNVFINYITIFLLTSLSLVVVVYGIYSAILFILFAISSGITSFKPKELTSFIIDMTMLPLGVLMFSLNVTVRTMMMRTMEHVMPNAPMPGTALKYSYTCPYTKAKSVSDEPYIVIGHSDVGEQCQPIVLATVEEVARPKLREFEKDRRKGILRSCGTGIIRGSHKRPNPEAISYRYITKTSLPLGSDFIPSGIVI